MSWEKVKLGEVCTITAGQSPESKFYNQVGEGLPFFQGKADFGINTPKIRYYTNHITKVAKPFDILLSVRAPVGPTNICDVEACIGRGLASIRATEKTHYKYVYYFFKSIQQRLSDSGNGSTFSAITTSDVKNIEIPLPPLNIQQHIADVLDKADALKQKDQLLLQKYDELAQSIFYNMFGDPVKNEKGWEVKKLKDIGIVKTGNTPPRANPKYYGNHVEWIKTDNILLESLHPLTAKEYLSKEGESVGRTVDKNSILVTCIAGSESSIGNCVLTDRKVAFNQQINSFTPNIPTDNLFLYSLFRGCKKLIQESTTKGMKRIITKSNFEQLKFIVPPYELQCEYSKKLSLCNQQKTSQEYITSKSKQLFDTLLNKYFSN